MSQRAKWCYREAMVSFFLKKLPFFFLLIVIKGFAIYSGNPGDPALMKKGAFTDSCWWISGRVGYIGDYVYREKFHDEFQIAGCTDSLTDVQMYTNAGKVTLNFLRRLDLYGILGATKMQIDQEAFSKTRFSWGIGLKAVIFHGKRWIVGTDLKYFESNQKPLYFICADYAYNIVNEYIIKYEEVQGSLGVTYRTRYLAPYINATYIQSKLAPQPKTALVRYPFFDVLIDVPTKSEINRNRFGMAVGASILDHRKAQLTLEWRVFNQNSVTVFGDVRF